GAPLLFKPAQQPPLRRSHSALHPALYRIGHIGVVEQVIVRLRPVERQRQVLLILPAPACEGARLPVSIELLPRIHDRTLWKSDRVYIVAAAAVVVIRVPGVGRG